MRTARPEPSGFAAKAKDLQALRDAVDQAATVSGALWISYLFVFFYLAIAAGAVTHKDLFFENPVKLPFLNVELPLIAFFALGPLLFLIVHAYTLLHFVLLAGKVDAFQDRLTREIENNDIRKRLRRQLPINIFVQFLAGPRDVRAGIIGTLLKLVAWISCIIGPICLLLLFELQFLAYHSQPVTWWHRFLVAADLVLIWVLWPRIRHGGADGIRFRDFLNIRGASSFALSFVIFTFSLATVTFPGERLQEMIPDVPLVPRLPRPLEIETVDLTFPVYEFGIVIFDTLHNLLVGSTGFASFDKYRSPWPNRLVLPDLDIKEHTKFDKNEKIALRSVTIRLRERHFEEAVLIGANLSKVDFTGAQLGGALLDDANLQEARFECTSKLSGCADLRHASLARAKLQNAVLERAQIEGASFEEAELHGAQLYYARLQGANLNYANLQGAQMIHAQMLGASLDGAKLQGADMLLAKLQAASLRGAYLQGVDLGNAELLAADLSGISLRGANMDGADLPGTWLSQGNLESASLRNVFALGANASSFNAVGARISLRTAIQKYTKDRCFLKISLLFDG